MHIPPRFQPFDEFPASALTSDGIQTLQADRSPCLCRVNADIIYAQKSGMPLRLTVIQPPPNGQHTSYPLIMFVQGSAWRKQQLAGSLPGLMRFAQRGYVIAIVEYRPSHVAPFPAQVIDAKTAIRWMKQHADQFNANADKLILWGDSSGGHTVVMAALNADNPAFDDYMDNAEPLRVKAVVDYYGPIDITRMNEVPSIMEHYQPDSPEGLLIGGRHVQKYRAMAAATSPLSYITDATPPPILIIHGDKDRLVPFHQSILLYEALKAKGHPVEMHKLLGADHGGDAFYKDNVLDIVEEFINR